MQTEIQTLIDHPETVREMLRTDQLDRLIRKAVAVWGQTITMRYRVRKAASGVRFEAENEQDLVGASGIFARVLTKCQIDTFNSSITYTPENGYRVWFTLNLQYQHFEGGTNGMDIATFRFGNGEWTMSNYKAEER